MLEVLNVSKYYGALPAVRDVSFTARRGEVPNGLSRLRAGGYRPVEPHPQSSSIRRPQEPHAQQPPRR